MSSSATNTTSAAAPSAGRYRVDPQRTTVRFTTRHLFGLGRAVGTVRLREADLVVGDPATATTLRAVLDAGSFDTGNAGRDGTVRSAKYLDTAAHPDITFTCADIRRIGEKWVAQGLVTAHGVSSPLELSVEGFDEAAGEVTLQARARVDRYAHGVTAGRGLAGRWLTVDISAVATR